MKMAEFLNQPVRKRGARMGAPRAWRLEIRDPDYGSVE
jgi:hypothetical protein